MCELKEKKFWLSNRATEPTCLLSVWHLVMWWPVPTIPQNRDCYDLTPGVATPNEDYLTTAAEGWVTKPGLASLGIFCFSTFLIGSPCLMETLALDCSGSCGTRIACSRPGLATECAQSQPRQLGEILKLGTEGWDMAQLPGACLICMRTYSSVQLHKAGF